MQLGIQRKNFPVETLMERASRQAKYQLKTVAWRLMMTSILQISRLKRQEKLRKIKKLRLTSIWKRAISMEGSSQKVAVKCIFQESGGKK